MRLGADRRVLGELGDDGIGGTGPVASMGVTRAVEAEDITRWLRIRAT
jgi:hypothetical protein